MRQQIIIIIMLHLLLYVLFLWLFLLLCSYFSPYDIYSFMVMLYVIIIFGILYQINLASSIFSASFSFDFLLIFLFFSSAFSVYRSFFLLFSPLSAIRCHFLSNDFNRSPSIRLEWDSVTVLNYTLYFYDVCCNALLLLLFIISRNL